MIIYCHTLNPRVQYITDLLSRYFSHPFKVTGNQEVYLASPDFRINYSHERIAEGELYFKPTSLLFETEKRPHTAQVFEHNGYKAFFKTVGDTGFDLFAATFFLLTRYEEYLPHRKDGYGRFHHEASLAYKEGFLHLPLVNIWLEDFRRLLQEKYPEAVLQRTTFRFQPTYDIDIAWSHKHKGFKRASNSFLQSLFKGRWRLLSEQVKVLRGKMQDPYDSYEWMDELHRTYGLEPVYFFPVPKERGKFDRNIETHHPRMQELIRSISARYTFGLHPSWASGDDPALVGGEKKTLEGITEKSVTASRQHYIRMNLPATYQKLLSLGITDDYSMGYGGINGFRASVATPYYWYDLQSESATRLLLHPFCFMDANAYYEEKKGAGEALEELQQYRAAVQAVNGTMITIWHNHFLGTAPEFDGWRETYRQFISGLR